MAEHLMPTQAETGLAEAQQQALIIGCGWLGAQLAVMLQQAGFRVAGSRRSQAALATLPQGVTGYCWDGVSPMPPPMQAALKDSWLICAMPPAIALDGGQGYLATLAQIVAGAAAARGLVLCSSTGVYSGLQGRVSEAAAPGPSARAAVLWQAEQRLLKAAGAIASRSYVLRLAGLVGPGRHPASFCRRGELSGPDDAVNLVHSGDVGRFLLALFAQQPAERVFNLSLPLAESKQSFYTAACLQAGLPAPRFSPPAGPAHQVDSSASQHILNFHYQFTDLIQASR